MPSIARNRLFRDVILVFLGALSMHFFSALFHPFDDVTSSLVDDVQLRPQQILQNKQIVVNEDVRQHIPDAFLNVHNDHIEAARPPALAPVGVSPPTIPPSKVIPVVDVSITIPETTIVEHVPGWTVFKNLYMSNGTLFVVSSKPRSEFPELQYITSTGLGAENTPENIEARMPTSQDMDFISPEEAKNRWGSESSRNRIWSLSGNSWLFNDPPQFLAHYYHFVAELIVGTWAFWNAAFDATVDSTSWTTSAPPVARAIFAHSDGSWRDGPGFNSYFLRAAFPSLTVEIQQDWEDRIKPTLSLDRAWHFDAVLLADRSAAFKGRLCGSTNQRTASEAYDPMWEKGKLKRGWWEPLRREVLRFAGVEDEILDLGVRIEKTASKIEKLKNFDDRNKLLTPFEEEKGVITYISRQAARRHLIPEDHDGLVEALRELSERRGYELNVIQAEHLTKDEQLTVMARTTVLIGVHGNGLSHLLFLAPSRFTTVIEIFFPKGFAHDYEWTTRAMGSKHFAVWNDTYHTHPNAPGVDYPEGFQGSEILAHGPSIAKLIEDRLDGRFS